MKSTWEIAGAKAEPSLGAANDDDIVFTQAKPLTKMLLQFCQLFGRISENEGNTRKDVLLDYFLEWNSQKFGLELVDRLSEHLALSSRYHRFAYIMHPKHALGILRYLFR